MQQFHSVSRFDCSDFNKNEQGQSSDSDRLQILWDKLQDLSEVQDQSRNEQIPMLFCNDNSVFSRHSQNEQFLQAVNVLDNYGHQIDQLRQEKAENKRVKFYHVEMSKSNQPQLNQKQSGKKLMQLDLYQRNENLSELNLKLVSDNQKLFDQCIKLRRQLLYHQLRTDKQKCIQANKTNEKLLREQEQKINKQREKIKQFEEENMSLMERIRQMEAKQSRYQREIDEVFQRREGELRRQIKLELEKKYREEIMQLKIKIQESEIEIEKLMAKINQANTQLSKLKTQLKVENDIRLKLQNQIHYYESPSYQSKTFSNQFKHISDQLAKPILNGENQQNVQPVSSNKFNSLAQKDSRATSVKSTSISCSSTINQITQFTTHQRPHIILNQFIYEKDQNQQIQSVLKAMERQITNIKIVHESELKKYKNIIKQLELQLQLNSGQSFQIITNKNSISFNS